MSKFILFYPVLHLYSTLCSILPTNQQEVSSVSVQVKRFGTAIYLETTRIAMACIVGVQFALLSGIQPTGISHQKQISLGFASHYLD